MAESPGKRLQNARIGLGLSIEEVTGATRMRPAQITSLENDDYKSFSSMTYARNYLQLYSKFLKVDVSDALEHLVIPNRVGVENYQYLRNQGDEDTAYRPVNKRPRPSSITSSTGPSAKWLLLPLIGIPLLGLAIMLVINLQRLGISSSHSTSSDATVLTEPTPTPESTPVATPTPEPTATPVRLWEDTPTPNPTAGPADVMARPAVTPTP